jgi:hypothetical protein
MGCTLLNIHEKKYYKMGGIMSNCESNTLDKIEALEKGLFLMSEDRIRALSNHETVDLIKELRAIVASMKKDAQSS